MTTGGYANWAMAGAAAPDRMTPRPIVDPMVLALMTGSSCFDRSGLVVVASRRQRTMNRSYFTPFVEEVTIFPTTCTLFNQS
jgi:hypothetical protein